RAREDGFPRGLGAGRRPARRAAQDDLREGVMTVTEMKTPYIGVIPYVCVSDARAAAKLYEAALGARIVDQRPGNADGRLIHCELLINGNAMMLNDPFPEYGMTQTGAGS